MVDAATGHPRPGELIAGKYLVEQVLGAGGMGVVVAAWHAALRQRVAVKLLLPEATRFPDAAARFLQEAQTAGAIRSEHVARVIDVGTLESGTPFMVMEYLAGTDLRKLLRKQGPLPVSEAVDFVLQAIEAIAEAHALGIVHRDLKPANIFLTHRADGSPLVKVLDFGLSKVLGGEQPAERSLTTTDLVAGSPEYMSPEQVRSLRNVDWRTDVWAMGVVLYELLTRKRPFSGRTGAALCASIAADAPVPLRAHRADLPEGLEALIAGCLEKDPNRRTSTMGELALGLSPFAPARSLASIERAARLSPGGAPGSGPGQRSAPESEPFMAAGGPAATQTVSSAQAFADGAPTIADAGQDRLGGASAPSSVGSEGWGRTGQTRQARRGVPVSALAAVIGVALLSTGALVWQIASSGASPEPSAAPALPPAPPDREEPAGEAPPEVVPANGTATALPAATASATATSPASATAASVTSPVTTAPAPHWPPRKPPPSPLKKKPDLSLDKPL